MKLTDQMLLRRWTREKELMRRFFPEFEAFINPPKFGFQGKFTVRAGVRMIVYEVIDSAQKH